MGKLNILNKTLCYLGGNLENSDDSINWRADLTTALNKMGIVCLDPTKQILTDKIAETEEDRTTLKKWRENGEFDKIHSFMRDVIRRDLRSVDFSAFVIFKLEPSKPTWGTVHELVLASQQRKPILLLINDRKQTPLWVIGLVNMDFVFETMDDLVAYLESVDSGKVHTDDKYWKLLREEFR